MPAAITSYASLVAAFEDYVARPDLTEAMPLFLQNTEAWLNRRLRTREMQTTATLAAATGGYTLPDDFLEWVGAQHTPTGGTLALSLRYVEPDSPEFRHRFRPNGAPQYFTVFGAQIQIRPAKPGTLTLAYYRRVPGLTEAATTNFLLALAPELYLYGVLAEAYRFQKDEANAQEWADKAEARLAALMGQADTAKTGRRPARASEDAAEATARATPT